MSKRLNRHKVFLKMQNNKNKNTDQPAGKTNGLDPEKSQMTPDQITAYNVRSIFCALKSEQIETVCVDVDYSVTTCLRIEAFYANGTKEIIDESNNALTKISYKIDKNIKGAQGAKFVNAAAEAADLINWAHAISRLSQKLFEEQQVKNSLQYEDPINFYLEYSTEDCTIETDFEYLYYPEPKIESVEDVYEFGPDAQS